MFLAYLLLLRRQNLIFIILFCFIFSRSSESLINTKKNIFNLFFKTIVYIKYIVYICTIRNQIKISKMKTFTITSELENKFQSEIENYSDFNQFLEVEKYMFYFRQIIAVCETNTFLPAKTAKTYFKESKSTYTLKSEGKELMNTVFKAVKGTFASKVIMTAAKEQNGTFTEKQIEIICEQLSK